MLGFSLSALVRLGRSRREDAPNHDDDGHNPDRDGICVVYFLYQAAMSFPIVCAYCYEMLVGAMTACRCCRYTSRCSCVRVSRILTLTAFLLAVVLNFFGFAFYWSRFDGSHCEDYPIMLA